MWPGVSPFEVQQVLHGWWEREPEPVGDLLVELLAMSGPDAASHLSAPLLAELEHLKPWHRGRVFMALDVVVRAGGNPSHAGLEAAAKASGHFQTAGAAGRFLRRAALEGWSLLEVFDELEHHGTDSKEARVRHALRLARLQRAGEWDALASLSAVYRMHRYGNLHPAIGLVEAQLLAEDPEAVAEAREALSELERFEGDMHSAWYALVPVLVRNLSSDDERDRAEAARSFRHVTYGLDQVDGLSEAEARAYLLPTLNELMPPLAAVLEDPLPHIAAQAAETLHTFESLGASLEPIREQVEAGLDHANVHVREQLSDALTRWRRRVGEEASLPPGYSHRRRYAANDEPIDQAKPRRCGMCESLAVRTIFCLEDISQTHAHITVETRCSECGVYAEHHTGYG